MAKEKEIIEKGGFNFKFNPAACRHCQGSCCNGESGNIFVNSKEIKAISRYLGIKVSQFIEEYLKKESYKFSIKEIKTDDNYSCIFFDREKNSCSIYPVRPHQCKTFPFWSYFKDKAEELAEECPGVILH